MSRQHFVISKTHKESQVQLLQGSDIKYLNFRFVSLLYPRAITRRCLRDTKTYLNTRSKPRALRALRISREHFVFSFFFSFLITAFFGLRKICSALIFNYLGAVPSLLRCSYPQNEVTDLFVRCCGYFRQQVHESVFKVYPCGLKAAMDFTRQN